MYSKQNIPNQKPGEQVLFFLHRHWIVPTKIFAVSIFLSLIPIIAYFIFKNSTAINSEFGYGLIVLSTSAYYLFVILYSFTNYIDYYLDVWIVTTTRIINIEQKGLFGREVSEKDLGRMQDITSEVKGFWATVFKYGQVYIQTAGEEQRFRFKQVPNAEEITHQISNLVAKYRAQTPQPYNLDETPTTDSVQSKT